MAEINIREIIQEGVKQALDEPFLDGRSIVEWAAIGIKASGCWISVKKLMPKPNDSVLLAVYDRDHGYVYRTVAWLNTSGDWDSNDDGFNQGDEDVLYWMPLPEPPEGVSGDG